MSAAMKSNEDFDRLGHSPGKREAAIRYALVIFLPKLRLAAGAGIDDAASMRFGGPVSGVVLPL
jgi:hypothetical protein